MAFKKFGSPDHSTLGVVKMPEDRPSDVERVKKSSEDRQPSPQNDKTRPDALSPLSQEK